MFDPLTTTGAGETLVQSTGEARLVADCKVKPGALVGHVKITSAPKRKIVSRGALFVEAKERLNTVPSPGETPQPSVVPYRVLFNRVRAA